MFSRLAYLDLRSNRRITRRGYMALTRALSKSPMVPCAREIKYTLLQKHGQIPHELLLRVFAFLWQKRKVQLDLWSN